MDPVMIRCRHTLREGKKMIRDRASTTKMVFVQRLSDDDLSSCRFLGSTRTKRNNGIFQVMSER